MKKNEKISQCIKVIDDLDISLAGIVGLEFELYRYKQFLGTVACEVIA